MKETHENEINRARDDVGQLQDYTRKDNIIIHNLPLHLTSFAGATDGRENASDLRADVSALFQHILPSHEGNFGISTLHRLPLSSRSRAAYPPVVVKFYERDVKNELMYHRKTAKTFLTNGANNKPVFLAEHLGPTTLHLLTRVKKLQDKGSIRDAWVFNNKFFNKKNDDNVRS